YISTNNCAGEEITFELYRLKKRFLLKDSLVLIASSTKTVSSSSKLSVPVVASIDTEDGSSSNYRFRVRLTKYLPVTNTTNTTLPPPPATNITGLPDLIVEKIEFINHVYQYQYGYISAVPLGDTMTLGEPDPYARITTKNIGGAFDIYPSSPFTAGIITKDGSKLTSFSGASGGKMNASQSTAFVWGFVSNTVGKYCIEGAKADSENSLLESNENNNDGISPKCLTITANTTNTSTPPPTTNDILRISPQTWNPSNGLGVNQCYLSNQNLICEHNMTNKIWEAGDEFQIYAITLVLYADARSPYSVKNIKLVGPLPSTNTVAEKICSLPNSNNYCELDLLNLASGNGSLKQAGKYKAVATAVLN
ncbi:hypothetical protein HYX16_03680, partial [Candidatus Woesearchaeota archaeon]|nr:hypothetical protein [Candidatus Woesearchaeota archaeon]